MGKKANFVKFIWLAKYFLNVFATDLNLKKCFLYRQAAIFFIMADCVERKLAHVYTNTSF